MARHLGAPDRRVPGNGRWVDRVGLPRGPAGRAQAIGDAPCGHARRAGQCRSGGRGCSCLGRAPGPLGSGLRAVAADELVWVRPNDFLIRGGADDTDVRLRLAYRIDLTVPMLGGDVHHIAIFVDAGSGALIAGVETA